VNEEQEKTGTVDSKQNVLCDLRSLDLAPMLLLNNAHAKETSLLNEAGLDRLLNVAFYARGVDRGATALLIALEHTADYANPNFAWFKTARASFIYIDRIIVASAGRGHGFARLLYEDLFAVSKLAGHNRAVCEVNVEPPNPASDAFHAAMGFKVIGEATIHDGAKRVRYFERVLG
jgi:predicted GNAT superfamily acetyltransferase